MVATPQQFQILAGEKFGVVALNRASIGHFASPLQLSPHVWVLTSAPLGVGHWREWVGSINADLIEGANLWLIAKQHSNTPNILDQENKDLWDEVLSLFLSLLLVGTPFYEASHLLTGAYVPGESPRIRRYKVLDRFLVSLGSAHLVVGAPDLQKASTYSPRVRLIHFADAHIRLRRGFKVFLDGLRLERPEERIHQFVRATEAIIKPGPRDIKRTMAQRSRNLAVGGKEAERVMRRLYELRSKEEHLADWEEALKFVPRAIRGGVLERSVRQAETLARNSYSRIFSNAQSFGQFADAQIDSFWALPERDRIKLWKRNKRARILEVV